MPLAAQSRLLRVLQERVVTPVGSTESVPVDILLITATNRPLSSRIDAGQFRADLFYRINGLSVQLPPLRQRTDKRELIQDIYRQHRDPGQREELPPQVLSALENHPWPGNIRQLVNVLRVAIAIADGEEVDIWHLPEDFLAEYDTASPPGKVGRIVQTKLARAVSSKSTRLQPTHSPEPCRCTGIARAMYRRPLDSFRSAAIRYTSDCANWASADSEPADCLGPTLVQSIPVFLGHHRFEPTIATPQPCQLL